MNFNYDESYRRKILLDVKTIRSLDLSNTKSFHFCHDRAKEGAVKDINVIHAMNKKLSKTQKLEIFTFKVSFQSYHAQTILKKVIYAIDLKCLFHNKSLTKVDIQVENLTICQKKILWDCVTEKQSLTKITLRLRGVSSKFSSYLISKPICKENLLLNLFVMGSDVLELVMLANRLVRFQDFNISLKRVVRKDYPKIKIIIARFTRIQGRFPSNVTAMIQFTEFYNYLQDFVINKI